MEAVRVIRVERLDLIFSACDQIILGDRTYDKPFCRVILRRRSVFRYHSDKPFGIRLGLGNKPHCIRAYRPEILKVSIVFHGGTGRHAYLDVAPIIE